MTKTTVDEERSFCGSAISGIKRRADVKEALWLMSYANCLPCTPVLQGYRIVRKSKHTMKVTSQLINGNKIKRKIENIKYRGKGQGREGTSQANAFSYGFKSH